MRQMVAIIKREYHTVMKSRKTRFFCLERRWKLVDFLQTHRVKLLDEVIME
jgi:hypothetical protein